MYSCLEVFLFKGVQQKYKLTFVRIEESDQAAHMRSLIRLFDRRSMGSPEFIASSGGKLIPLIRRCRCIFLTFAVRPCYFVSVP